MHKYFPERPSTFLAEHVNQREDYCVVSTGATFDSDEYTISRFRFSQHNRLKGNYGNTECEHYVLLNRFQFPGNLFQWRGVSGKALSI